MRPADSAGTGGNGLSAGGFDSSALTLGHKAAILIGSVWQSGKRSQKLFNAALWLENGSVKLAQPKVSLPNYGVFDEKRLFDKGDLPEIVKWRGLHLALMVCEDAWKKVVANHLAHYGLDLAIVINASPYEIGKTSVRRDILRKRQRKMKCPAIYLNTVGGQDELVFDGGSFVLDGQGREVITLPSFREATAELEFSPAKGSFAASAEFTPGEQELTEEEEIYQAMMLGLKDYVEKNHFPGVVLGLSGGIDSALTAAVAVDALGADRVHALMLPSRFTSQESLDDAAETARLLGIRLDTVSIEESFQNMEKSLAAVFAGKPRDLTEENLQSRIRGNLLMAVSNKLGSMVLTTGNKSEMSVGYATLYGDMCGGYSVLKDLYKTRVFKLSEWRNSHKPRLAQGPEGAVMPERVIAKPPTAELRENQRDEDSLPPYAVLDAVLELLVEGQQSVDEVVERGFDRALVERVAAMLYRAEYKRRQAPPGVKVTGMSFGRDRRYPITNGFRNARG
jgi:NAD+ synthase